MPEIGARRTRPKKVLLVLAVSAGVLAVVAVCVVLLAVKLGEAAGRARVANEKVRCSNNLKNIGGIAQERALRDPGFFRRGRAELLDVYRLGLFRRGDEHLFVCPRDPEGDRRMTAWGSGSPAPGEPGATDALASYVLRDFVEYPIPGDSRGKSPLAACLHHPDGVNVLYDDSSVVFLDREALGLAPEEPIETGPAAKNEILRLFHPARDR
jgi:hypothetical protein